MRDEGESENPPPSSSSQRRAANVSYVVRDKFLPRKVPGLRGKPMKCDDESRILKSLIRPSSSSYVR